MGVLSIIWGVLALMGMLLALPPCLGWLNWLNVPFAVIGLVISGISLGSHEPTRTQALVGFVMCLIALLVGALRLLIGAGIF